MTRRPLPGLRVPVIAALGALAMSAPAAAQGNSHGNAYGHYKGAVSSAKASSSSTGAPASSIPGTGVRNFGSWLDDASVMDVGAGFVSLGFNVWKTPVYREIDVPAIDSGYAIHRRVQVGMSVPFYHASEPGGPIARGVGDVYLNAKIQLRAPSAHHAGFGVIPMVEVLSVAPPSGGSRVNWALPASAEWQRKGWRAMATGGYFSRGAVFGSGAVEIELSKRVWATGSLNHSYSTRHDDLSAALGFHKQRTDVSGGLTVAIRPDVSVYVNLGRTISARDSNSATLLAGAGVVLGLKRRP
jgi:hypothetical protein